MHKLKISQRFDIREIYDYTMILPKTFYDSGSYTKWIRVGMALCNIDKSFFIIWVAMSAKAENFEYHKIHELWSSWQTFTTSNSNGLTKRSIMYWGREENPIGYNDVLKSSTNNKIEVVLNRVIQER